MTWKTVLFIFLAIVIAFFVWHNGVFRTGLRIISGKSLPSEIKKITYESKVEFDLSEKLPAILQVGIYYPKGTVLKEVDDDLKFFNFEKDLDIELYRGDKLIKESQPKRIKKIYQNFEKSDYDVAVFYTFFWSPKIKVPGREEEQDNSRIIIYLNNQFKNLELILFEYRPLVK